MNRRPLLRVIAALAASVLSIYLLSIIKSGPGAAADFDCSSDPGQRTASIDVASGETGLEIARELFEKDERRRDSAATAHMLINPYP